MPKFAANLSFLWPELPPLERFAAAARAGFRQVEYLFPQELDAGELEAALRANDLELVLFDTWPGDWDAGERGYLSLPGKEGVLRRTVEEALELARRFRTLRLNILGGILTPDLNPKRAFDTAVANLIQLAPLAEESGVSLLLENLNPTDVPNYAFPTVDSAAKVVEALGHYAAGLQLDQYHISMTGGDPIAVFRQHQQLVRHVQISDAPGRHQPGTGSAPIREFLQELDRCNYDLYVGLEYRPLGSTEESLTWMGSL